MEGSDVWTSSSVHADPHPTQSPRNVLRFHLFTDWFGLGRTRTYPSRIDNLPSSLYISQIISYEGCGRNALSQALPSQRKKNMLASIQPTSPGTVLCSH